MIHPPRPRPSSPEWLRKTAALLALGFLLPPFLSGCDGKDPIRLGFVATMSGRASGLGVEVRDGFLMAVADANAGGGIQGHPVEAVLRDDRGDAATAQAVDREILDAGVAAVVGHMTSSMTLAGLPLMNRRGVVLMSPTASADHLSGLDDHFFRVVPSSRVEAEYLARYVAGLGARRFVGIVDTSNPDYTTPWMDIFRSGIENTGGRVDVVAFDSRKEAAHVALVVSVLDLHPEGVVIAAPSLDTAMICQQLAKFATSRLLVVSSGWAATPDLILHGGRTVEGIVLYHGVRMSADMPGFTPWREAFMTRYRREPTVYSLFGYEAASVLIQALRRNPDAGRLKRTLLDIRRFEGVAGPIEFDAAGDVARERHPMTIRDHRFVYLE